MNRLECATFHILTPYPGTPLFRQMEDKGRLLHRNWDLLPYLGMSYLYNKQSNRLWPFLIRHRLTHAVWGPLVEASRRRHVRHRRRLLAREAAAPSQAVVIPERLAAKQGSLARI